MTDKCNSSTAAGQTRLNSVTSQLEVSTDKSSADVVANPPPNRRAADDPVDRDDLDFKPTHGGIRTVRP